jgi:type II secretory pathway component PulC
MFLKRYFWAINLVLITLFTWASVDLFLAYVSAKLDQRPLPRLSACTAKPQDLENKPKPYFAMVTEHNVFDPYGEGHVPKPAASVYVPPPPPPLSSQIKLKGTIAGGSDYGLAIVEDLIQRRGEVVKIGGRVRNAVLRSVTRDKAVFEVDGRQETLPLAEKDPGMPPGPARGTSPVPRGMDYASPASGPPPGPTSVSRGVYPPPAPASNGDFVRPLSPNRYSVDRQRLSQIGNQRDSFSGEGKMTPQNGGLMVNDVPSGGMAEKAGLRSGDVVKSINGDPVSTPAQAYQAYQKALGGQSVRVEVERNRRSVYLTYELK